MGVNYYDDGGRTDEHGVPLPGNRRYRPQPTPIPAPGRRGDPGGIWGPVFAIVAIITIVVLLVTR